jgi:hypothetical protein
VALTTATDAPYAAAWKDLRCRQWVMWGVYLAFFPCKWLLATVYAKSPHYRSPQIFVIAGSAWIVAFVVTSYWAASWRCPRCNEIFTKGTWYRNAWTRCCLSCGLPRGAPNGTEPGISS